MLSDSMTPNERARAQLVEMFNLDPQPKEFFVDVFGAENVWDTRELQEKFLVKGFAAPFVFVVRKADGVPGVVCFQHFPRVYFSFEPLF